MGVKLNLYGAIVTALEAVTEIKTIEKWNNQPNKESEEIPVAYPAAYIGFSSIEWLPNFTNVYQFPTTTGQQSGNMTITIYAVFEKYPTSGKSFGEYEPILQKIWQALQGLSGTEYQPLMRVAEREDSDHDNVIIWEIDFSTGVVDCAIQDTTLIDASPVTLDLQVDVDIEPSTVTGIRTAGDFIED